MALFHVVIPAAGTGSRMNSGTPKQYLPIAGKPIIQHTLGVFSDSPHIDSIVVALSPGDDFWNKLHIALHEKVSVLRCGGDSRSATVLNALETMAGSVSEDDWILVHDAVRPGLSQATLSRLLETLEQDTVGGLLAVPLADTLKRADDDQRVEKTEPRDHLWQAQTPQMFRYGLLKKALKEMGSSPTDEAQAVEALGLRPKLVQGESRNIKITYPQDLQLAEAILGMASEKRA
ncbi:MAG TPA: 2-C-methyl-D-erythritol 4-phosphate cytidylyltransferase [Methylophilaceae bacterium]|nr:2-C-methyl-D-erythritol 4-phosphate cytidylyltransferase [Methylophilaceae bacterium]